MPPVLLRDILQRLPADQRARAACVCRAWRVAAADPALWRRLDLTAASGVRCRNTDAALRAAAARGGLEVLDVTGRACSLAALRAVVAVNAVSLRELRTLDVSQWLVDEHEGEVQDEDEPSEIHSWAALRALLAAGPALQVLEANVHCWDARARPLLRNEPPYGPLRLRRLEIQYGEDQRDVLALAPELVAHPSLTGLHLYGGMDPVAQLTQEELHAVVDAALALGLASLGFEQCLLSPDVAPALARLLSSAALKTLSIHNNGAQRELLDAHAAALLSSALRGNRTLQRLTLCGVRLWDDVAAAVELLDALTGHASLYSLDFESNVFAGDAAAAADIGAALGALVAADARALTELSVWGCNLGDAGLAPLVDALPRNTHLRRVRHR
jgi:hypothetical protein